MNPENIPMEDLGEEYDMKRAMPEETSFFDEPSRAFDEFDEFDDYDKDIPIEEVIKQSPFDPNLWVDENWANRNTDADKRERWAKTQKIKITNERKTFFREFFNIEVVMKDGPASRKLIKESKLTVSEKTGKVNGIEYKEVKVAFRKGKGFTFSENERSKNTVEEFRNLMEKARLEHNRTANSAIEDAIGSLPGTSSVNKVRANVIDEIQDEITNNADAVETAYLTTEEVRDFGGILKINNIRNLKAVEREVVLWSNRAKAETNPERKSVLESISKVAKLKADELRLKENIKPTSDEASEIINEDVLTKFEKFKKWAKENMLGLSAISITVAGILVTIFSAAKTVIKGGANALGKFAKAVANIAKKFGPIIGAVGQVIASVLSYMVVGLKWLAKNLWLLAVALTYFIYNEYKTRQKTTK